MGKALGSIATIGGGVLGGLFGGPAGALVGGALGSSLSGSGEVNARSVGAPLDARALSQQGGFSGSLTTPGYSLSGNILSAHDQSMKPQYLNIANSLADYNPMFGGLRGNLSGIRGDLASMREQIRPGFGRLSQAKVQAIKDAGAESVGNLRESLARRNVLGSSFANDAISREQMTVGREVERASAEAIVAELGMELQRMGMELGVNQQDAQLVGASAQVIAQRASMYANQMDRDLQELGVAGNIRNGVNAQISAQAMQLAQLQMLQQTSNAGMGMQADMANAGMQSDLSGLMLAGTMGSFGKGGVMQGKTFSSIFGG